MLSLSLSLSLSLCLSLFLSASTQPPYSESGAPPTSPGETELATTDSLITCAHHLTVCISTVWYCIVQLIK